MKTSMILSVLGVLLTLLASGCTTSRSYDQPNLVTTTLTSGAEGATTTTSPVVKSFKVGDTASNEKVSVTINNVRYANKITEKSNDFLWDTAEPGMNFAIIDLTIANLQSEKTYYASTTFFAEVSDKDGYTYDSKFSANMALNKAFNDGDILPNQQRRGEVAFEIPQNATGLKFLFKYDFAGTTAVFNL